MLVAARALTLCVCLWLMACADPHARVVVEGKGGGPLPGGVLTLAEVENLGSVAGVAPRLSVVLVAADQGQAITVLGLSPLRESAVSDLPAPIVDGRPLSAEPGWEVVITRELRDTFNISLGAPLSLADHTGKRWDPFTVVGISTARAGDAQAFMHISDLQELNGHPDRLDRIVLLPFDPREAASLADEMRARLPMTSVSTSGGGLPLRYAWAALAVFMGVTVAFFGWRRTD